MWYSAVLCFFLGVLVWVFKNRKFIQQYRRLGCRYTALPFLGHAHMFAGDREAIMNTFIKFAEEATHRGGVVPLWLLNEYYLCIADPLDAEAVLKNFNSKDKILWKVRYLTGDSFIFAPVEQWKPRRRQMAPLFSVKTTTSFMGVFARQSDRFARLLRSAADRRPVSLWTRIYALTLDTACETVLGAELNSQLDTGCPLLEAMDKMVSLAGDGLTKIYLHNEFLLKRHHSYRSFLKHQAVIHRFLDEAIRKLEEENHNINTNHGNSLEDEGAPECLVSRMLQLGLRSGARDEALGLLLAATDTVATTIAFVTLMLARHPRVQDKLYQELQEVFGDSDRAATLADVSRLEYLEAVTRETLRLYPPGPNLAREADRNLMLPSGIEILKGTNIILSNWGVQRNPKYWGADAHEFRPERFLEGPLPHQSAFLAFSAGPRSCTGGLYATMMAKTALSTLVRRYRILPANEDDHTKPLRLLFSVVIKEIDDFTVRLQSRV